MTLKEKKMEAELNNTLNTFEKTLVALQGKLSQAESFKLRAEYIELKYDVIKLILRANRKDAFDFDTFQDLSKISSPMLKLETKAIAKAKSSNAKKLKWIL